MESQLSCPLCSFQYGQQKTPRILSMCGHTFCQSCIETLILGDQQQKWKIICPQDDTAAELTNNNIKQFPINKALMKIIQSNKSKSSFKDNSFDVSKIVKQQQIQQDQETKQLITAIKQSQQQQETNQNKLINERKQQNERKQSDQQKQTLQQENDAQDGQDDENLCLLHQKPLEVVCIVDLQKICAKCAIFGQHKGHQFKSIQQIQQQNDTFYHELLAVYEQKTEIISRLDSKITKPDLLSILTSNKDALTKQIKQRFKKLIDTIKNQQKKALLKLQKIIQKVEKDIDDLYQIQPQIVEKYQEWQRNSYQKLQIIQKGTFQQKLQLLLVDQKSKDKNIIIQGKKIVQKIKTQEDNIISKAEVFLSNINMKTSDKVFDFIQNYVQIFDKLPEAPKPQPVIHSDTKLPSSESLQKEGLNIIESPKKHSEDDLLYIDGHQEEDIIKQQKMVHSMKTVDNIKIQDVKYVPILESKMFQKQKQKSAKKQTLNSTVQQLQKHYQNQQNLNQLTSRQNSFVSDKVVRPTKKKLKTIKVPQKYEKILDSLYADTSETLDLTNAELGDSIILQICEFIPGTKIKTVKFIRNKLTDDCMIKMLPFLSNVITLNLSQNLLTERVLDIFIDHRQMLPKVKSIILSLNKIIERKHKHKIDLLRKLQITVSV